MSNYIEDLDIRSQSGSENLLSRGQGQRILEGIKRRLTELSSGGILILDFRNIHYATAACLTEILDVFDVIRKREFQNRYVVLRSKGTNSELNFCLTLAFKETGKGGLWLDEEGNWEVFGELTKAQKDTLEVVREGKEVTSTEVSKLLNIPINAASNRLKDLYDMRLIRREERILSATGGRQFVYRYILC